MEFYNVRRDPGENQNVVIGLKPMLTRLTRFKILVSSLCVVFAGAFSAQAQ